MFNSLGKIDDIPLTFPTEEGGCHPLWVLGHLAFVEGLAYQILAGGENPAGDWATLFGPDTIPTDDVAQYPAIKEVRAKYVQLRQRNSGLPDYSIKIHLDMLTPYQ